jgi:hypothetical protein
MIDITIVVMCKVIVTRAKPMNWICFFLASIFFLVALLLLGLERGHGVKRGDFQRLWFNANNGHHHRLPLAGTDE